MSKAVLEECYFYNSCVSLSNQRSSQIECTYNTQKQQLLDILCENLHQVPSDLMQLINKFACCSLENFVLHPLQTNLAAIDGYFNRLEVVTMFLSETRTDIIITGSNAGTLLCLRCFITHFLEDSFNLHEMFDGRYAPLFIQDIQKQLQTMYRQKLTVIHL